MPTQIKFGSVYPTAGSVRSSICRRLILLLPFAYLWFHLIDNLRFEWLTDPQYSYGLIVPLLVIGLLIRRWHRFSQTPLHVGALNNSRLLMALVVFLAFLYLPTRLLEEATPEWRPLGWLLGMETIGLTLYAIYLVMGTDGLKRFAFPIGFFFVAIPWPTLFEHPIIQALGRANAAMVVNALSIVGVPAIQHGNVIEVSTGLVGINDACSGIRSIQSSLMISLFLGEFYFMKWPLRLLLIPAGFILAMFFNLCRTSLLTYLAAKDGIAAISKYHDEAGITILLACTATLWGVSYLASFWGKGNSTATKAPDIPKKDEDVGKRNRAFKIFFASLLIWIVFVEAGTELWYAIRESYVKPGPKWSLVLPENNPTFKELPFTTAEHELLRFDNGRQGQWQASDGTTWQAFYFNWLPGRVAGYLAKRHTPDVCLTGEGLKMVAGPTLMMLDVNHVRLPMRSYIFDGPAGPLQVYQCHWEPGETKEAIADESSRFNLIRSIWAGRGDKGQKVIEIVISGYGNSAAAKEALMRELEKLIKVETPKISMK